MAQFEKGFRHKTVRHFKVGRFIFKDHILLIKADSEEQFAAELADFEKAWNGLHPSDKNAIRALKAVSNEESVTDGVRRSLAVRGPVDTGNIADRPTGDPVNQQANADGGAPANPAAAVTPVVAPRTLSAFKLS